MDDIIFPAALDMDKITYGTLKVLPNQSKSVFVAHNGKPIIMQTPKMRCPFNLSKWDKMVKGKDGIEKPSYKYDIVLSLDKINENPNMKIFYDKFTGWDEKFKTDGMKNSLNWLGKTVDDKKVIDTIYNPMLKYSIDKLTGKPSEKYPPNFKVTVPYNDGQFDCKVYGPDHTKMDLSQIQMQGAYVTAIIQCVGIWIAGKSYGCSWKLLQMKVEPKSNLPEYAIREVDSEKNLPTANEDDINEDDDVNNAESADDDDIVDSSEDELDAKPSTSAVKATPKPAATTKKTTTKK